MDAKDAISSLPDEVLGIILSFLSTREAASTSVLSKRWRNVFVLVSTLDLDNRYRYDDPIKFIHFVENLQGNTPIKKLTIKSHFYEEYWVKPSRVGRLISNVLERGVVDFDLFITYEENYSRPVPSLVFKSKTLVNLKLGYRFSVALPHDVCLPMLKTLCLDTIYFEGDDRDGAIETLLSRCPVLEELVVKEHLWIPWSGSVSSPSLKRLCIQIKTIASISFHFPNLVYFELSCEFACKYANVKMDSLVEARLDLFVDDFQIKEAGHGNAHLIHLINGIRNVKVLHLSKHVLELLYSSCQDLPMFNNLVCLSIESDKRRGWQILPLLIKNSPNLETLIFEGLNHYITKQCGDACPCNDSEETMSSCLSSCRVKLLEISGYRGTTRELQKVKHFLDKLPCLELVKIVAANKVHVARDMQKLLTLPRASSNCEIQVIF